MTLGVCAPGCAQTRGARACRCQARQQGSEPAQQPTAERVEASRRQVIQGAVTLAAVAAVPPPAALAGDWYQVAPAGSEPRTIVITGANSGIGYAAVQKLAAAGHRVHLVCRTQKKAETACAAVQAGAPGPVDVTPHECDLSSLKSIRDFVDAWRDAPIDALCLNAGAQFTGEPAPRRTADGFETTVGVNHLGHFLLANLLLPNVEASALAAPRIVVTASEVHDPTSAGGKVGSGATLGDLSGLRTAQFTMIDGGAWEGDKAYKDSKLCNILFARELCRRLRDSGSRVTVNSFGPGLVTRSNFFRGQSPLFTGVFDFITNDVLHVAETLEGAGGCLAFMAVDESLEKASCAYFNNDLDGIPGFAAHKFQQDDPSDEALDAAKGKALWAASAALVGYKEPAAPVYNIPV